MSELGRRPSELIREDTPVTAGIEKWLIKRRNQARKRGDSIEAEVIDVVLDDAVSAFQEGFLPWHNEWLERK